MASADQLDQMLSTGGGILAAGERARPESMLGTELPPFRLEKLLGAGGMAWVFLGVRVDEQFEQQVAVKILPASLNQGEHRQRFFRERQILAELDHPNIARMFDGGITADDRPYLVMEYVQGNGLDEVFRESHLDWRKRLEIMLDVARAVESAHARLIVHCDIKPANVMLDQHGTVKLLDFGIAELFAVEDSDSAAGGAMPVCTPLYAAPEQLDRQRAGTHTDIFQLGGLIYYAFTGQAPRVRDKDGSNSRPEMRADDFLQRCSVDMPGISQRDLAAVVSRCVQEEPEQRYASVSRLLDDLQAVLDYRPVAVANRKLTHRGRRFYLRNRPAIVTAAILALLTSSILVYQLRQIHLERDASAQANASAAAVSQFLTGVLNSVDPSQSSSIADQISASSFEFSQAQDVNGVPLVNTTARSLINLDRAEEAVALLVRALDTPSTLSKAAEIEQHALLGYAFFLDGDIEAGREQLIQAVDGARQDAPDNLHEYLQWLGLLERRAGNLAEAERLLIEAVDAVPAGRLAELSSASGRLALVQIDQQQFAKARKNLNEAIELSEPKAPALVLYWTNLAEAQRLDGRATAALRSAEEAVALANSLNLVPADWRALAWSALGHARLALNRLDAAESAYRAALEIFSRARGNLADETIWAAGNLGIALAGNGQCEEARALIDRAMLANDSNIGSLGFSEQLSQAKARCSK